MHAVFLERAQAIGGPVAEAFVQEAHTVRGENSDPHEISLEAILGMVTDKPELNDLALIRCLLMWASKYASRLKALEFKVALVSAVRWCLPQSLKALPEFNPGSVMRHRVNRDLPGLYDTLRLLAAMAGAGLYPVSAEALRNCIRLLHDYGLPNVDAALSRSETFFKNFEVFQRVCDGEEPTWA